MVADDGLHSVLRAKASLLDAMTIRVAATLRLPDLIAAGLRTAEQLASTVNAYPDALARVLRHLVTLDILRADSEHPDCFSVTDLGELLRGDDPHGVRPWLDIDGPFGYADLSAVHLLHTVQTGEPAFPQQFGKSFWEHLSTSEDHAKTFDSMMGSAPFQADLVATSYNWGDLGHVIDVGGGNGSLLLSLLHQHPRLTGTVIDLPGPADTARKNLDAAGLTDRADVVTGTFFDPLPTGAGGYILSAIIHNWNDQAAHTILQRCARAAHPTGKVLLVEAIDASAGKSPITEMDLRMLTYMGGRERTLDDITALAEGAGLTLRSVYPVGYRAVIELSAEIASDRLSDGQPAERGRGDAVDRDLSAAVLDAQPRHSS